MKGAFRQRRAARGVRRRTGVAHARLVGQAGNPVPQGEEAELVSRPGRSGRRSRAAARSAGLARAESLAREVCLQGAADGDELLRRMGAAEALRSSAGAGGFRRVKLEGKVAAAPGPAKQSA